MKTRRLGSEGPEITPIGYGAWEASGHWGTDLDEGQIIEAIRVAVEAGVNWIDTAEVYGPHTSEEIVGRAIVGLDVLVATKVAPKPSGSGFHRDEVRKACEGSLARLGRDAIDLYQLHWPDAEIPIEETWEAMATLADEGLVRHIGVSNFDREAIERCQRIRHVDSLQPHFSLMHRPNESLIAWCGEQGIGVVAYGPLAYGLLAGTMTKDTRFHPDDWRAGSRGFDLYDRFFAPGVFDLRLEQVEHLRGIAERAGARMADLAIAWVLGRPGVTSAIVGSRNAAHVRENLAAADRVIDSETLAELDRVFTA